MFDVNQIQIEFINNHRSNFITGLAHILDRNITKSWELNDTRSYSLKKRNSITLRNMTPFVTFVHENLINVLDNI